jgi:hypothetical protein
VCECISLTPKFNSFLSVSNTLQLRIPAFRDLVFIDLHIMSVPLNIYNTPYFDLPDLSPRAQKSRRRLQVVDVDIPNVAQGAYPQTNSRLPLVAPSGTMKREVIKTRSATPPERHSRHDIRYNKSSLHSSMHPMNSEQVSPPASSNSSSTALSELRTPPANLNLQKSRRRCIDFGLGRTPTVFSPVSSPPLLCPDDCNAASPSLEHEHEHESDSSSLFDDIAMVFPQPPPIFTSLRRVHSSPLLATKEVRRNVMGKHLDRKLHQFASNKHRSALANTTPAQAGHWTSRNGSDTLLDELELELEEVLLSSKETAIQSPPLASHTLKPCHNYRRNVSIIHSAPESQKSINFLYPYPGQAQTNEPRRASGSKYVLPTTVNSGASAITGKEKKLLHARSTSSLLHTLPRAIQKEVIASTFGHNSKAHSVAKKHTTVPVAPLNHRNHLSLKPSIGKPKAPCIQPLDCFDSKRTLAYAGHQKSTKRAHMSNPFVGLNFPNNSLAPPRSLGSPFHHRPSWSQPVSHATMTRYPSSHVPKSFIDITPEQDVHNLTRTRTELVRKLLARASRGVLNWGQSLALRPKHKSA